MAIDQTNKQENGIDSVLLPIFSEGFHSSLLKRLNRWFNGSEIDHQIYLEAKNANLLDIKHTTGANIDAFLMGRHLKYSSLIPLEISAVENRTSMAPDNVLWYNKEELNYIADLGTYWRMRSEWSHYQEEPRTGSNSPYTEDYVLEALKYFAKNSDFYDRAKKDIEVIRGYIEAKLIEIRDLGLISQEDVDELQYYMPRTTYSVVEVAYYNEKYPLIGRQKEASERQSIELQVEGPLKCFSNEFTGHLLNDPKMVFRMFVININKAIDRLLTLKHLNDIFQTDRGTHVMNRVGFYKSTPDDKQWKKIIYPIADGKAESLYLNIENYYKLGIGTQAQKVNILHSLVIKPLISLITEYNPVYTAYKWNSDLSSVFNNIQLAKKGNTVYRFKFKIDILKDQIRMLRDTEYLKKHASVAVHDLLRLNYRSNPNQILRKHMRLLFIREQKRMAYKAGRNFPMNHQIELFFVSMKHTLLVEILSLLSGFCINMNESIQNTKSIAIYNYFKQANPNFSGKRIAAAVNAHVK
jgi:hypothetical protein